MPNPNHRVVVNPGLLPFSAYPIQLTTTTPFVANYEVLSSGGVMRSLGKRIYDTSILLSSGSVTIQPNSPLLFPFITNQLPSTYFDAVFLLSINSVRYLQGFSNSPDNVAAYSINYFLENKKMFGIFLKCYGVNSAPANYDTNNHYMLGGDNSLLNSNASINIIFCEPTSTSITITLKFTFYSVTIVAPTLTLPTAIVPAGTTDFAFPTFNLYARYFQDTGYYSIDKSGYYKVEIISSDPSYVSILPFYHFGQFS